MRPPFVLLGALLVLCFVGCSAGPSQIEGISAGMNKAEVVAVLGEPRTISTVAGSEFLTFKVWRSFWRRQPGNYRDVHYVKFTGGRVVQYDDNRTLPADIRSQLKE